MDLIQRHELSEIDFMSRARPKGMRGRRTSVAQAPCDVDAEGKGARGPYGFGTEGRIGK